MKFYVRDLKKAIENIPDDKEVFVEMQDFICTNCDRSYIGRFPVKSININNRVAIFLNILEKI